MEFLGRYGAHTKQLLPSRNKRLQELEKREQGHEHSDSNQIPDNVSGSREPGQMGAKFETPYYDVDGLKDAIFYEDKSSEERPFYLRPGNPTSLLLFMG